MRRAVETRRRRTEAWRSTGERPMARNLALVGTLGWLVVAPTLLGAFVGRFLDRLAHTGVTFTAALLGLGAVVGCALAWQRVQSA